MERIEDRRIDKALDLLNAVARDRVTESGDDSRNVSADFKSLMRSVGDQAKSRATEKYEAGKRKVVGAAGRVDRTVHRTPWAFIGGAALTGLLVGLQLGRSRGD